MLFDYLHKKSWSLILLVGSYLLSSCETEVVPPDLTDLEEKLVVNCIMSSDQGVIKVEVSVSRNAFGVIEPDAEGDVVTEAEVIIRSPDNEEELIFTSFFNAFITSSGSFSFIPGEVYTLEVNARGQSITAQTTIPSRINRVESIVLSDDRSLNVSWRDIVNEENHYRIVGFGGVIDNNVFRGGSFDFGSSQFVSDDNKDGAIFSSRGDGDGIEFTDINIIQVNLISCEEIYLDYYRTLNSFSENPFSDPPQLPSNINGGLGIFTAINVIEVVRVI